MPNFSIKYSYTVNEVVYHKTAIVRASEPDVAKDKIVNFYLSHNENVTSFSFDSISMSSYNLILI